jgi:hypothetical protein
MATFPQRTTIGFGTTSTFAPKVRSIQLSEERDIVEVSDLKTTGYQEYIPGDLKRIPPIEVTCEWDPTDTTGRPPVFIAAETVTITVANSYKLVGTAFVSEYSVPIQVGELMVGTYLIQFDGKLGTPAWSSV